MRFRPFGLLIFTGLFLAACVHMPDPYSQVRAGMSKAQVGQLLGEPSDTSFVDGVENWTYSTTDFSGLSRVKIVTFKNEKVFALTNDELTQQRNHEIARAKAGATKIVVGTNSGYGGVYGYSNSMSCVHSNVFGKYPDGGGCNAFGCWPAGGECTAFGCSSAGHCGAVTCENKIAQLPCE